LKKLTNRLKRLPNMARQDSAVYNSVAKFTDDS